MSKIYYLLTVCATAVVIVFITSCVSYCNQWDTKKYEARDKCVQTLQKPLECRELYP